MITYIPYSRLPLEDWPAAVLPLLEFRQKPVKRFGRKSRSANWRQGTADLYITGTAYFLGWLRYTDRLEASLPFNAYLIEDVLGAYVEDMQGYGLSSRTIANRLDAVRAATQVLHPGIDSRWIMDAVIRLRDEPSDRRRTRQRMQPTGVMVDLGMTLIRQAMRPDSDLSQFWRAILFRDGLLLVFTSLVVPRLHPLAIMTINQHLVRAGDVYDLHWSADEMKENRPYDGRMGTELSALFTLYLSDFRPILADRRAPGTEPTNAVWLSRFGTPLSESGIYEAFISRTEAAFGESVFPHACRHGAATTLAMERPDLIEIITPLLQHRSESCREIYDMAESFEVGEEFGATLDASRFGKVEGRRLRQQLIATEH